MSWILIASRAGARIVDNQLGRLSIVEVIPNENGRLRNREIDSDRQGRSFSRTTSARHALQTEESAHEHLTKVFVRELADKLDRARTQGRFERLVLVAEPHLLGLLRAALSRGTRRRVVGSVAKDLHDVELRDLPQHLPSVVQHAPAGAGGAGPN